MTIIIILANVCESIVSLWYVAMFISCFVAAADEKWVSRRISPKEQV